MEPRPNIPAGEPVRPVCNEGIGARYRHGGDIAGLEILQLVCHFLYCGLVRGILSLGDEAVVFSVIVIPVVCFL